MDNQGYNASNAPVGQLNANRGLLKFILLSIVTCGIYGIVFFYSLASDLNIIASRYDGKKTMNYALLLFLIGPITCGIAYFVWYHNISNRIGDELRRRGIVSNFSAANFWLWEVLGSFIIVGPFIYMYQLCNAANQLATHYNNNG
jgi:hypothetical protein